MKKSHVFTRKLGGLVFLIFYVDGMLLIENDIPLMKDVNASLRRVSQ
jgi:hypothetical protein